MVIDNIETNMQKIQNILNWSTPGFVAVLIGMTSSIALIYQMVINLGGDSTIVSSWLLVLGLAMGITSIGLSIYYKVPLLIAWSTPGAALLITSTQGFNINEAIGAFIVCAVLIFISGISGVFEKIINKFFETDFNEKSKIILAKSADKIHPVIGLWHVSLLNRLSHFLEKKDRKIMNWVNMQNYEILNFENENYFFNINTRSDLEEATKIENSLKIQ